MDGKERVDAASQPAQTLITAGEFYLDLLFFGLERLPVLGEELKTDRFAFSLGGGAAITACAASRLGRVTQLLTVVGDSALDLEARARLETFGVDVEQCRVRAGEMSGLTVAASTPDDRSFLTCPGANRWVEDYLLSSPALGDVTGSGHVHFALAPSKWPPFLDLVTQLQGRGVTCSWDMGWDPAAARAPGFSAVCDRLDVLFLNEVEALAYAHASEIDEALETLSTQHNTVVVKRGERGAVARRSGSRVVADQTVEVKAMETTGAGDAFAGGFLHLWMEEAPLQDCLLAANICGALSTRRAGGVEGLPDREEFQACYQSRNSRPGRGLGESQRWQR